MPSIPFFRLGLMALATVTASLAVMAGPVASENTSRNGEATRSEMRMDAAELAAVPASDSLRGELQPPRFNNGDDEGAESTIQRRSLAQASYDSGYGDDTSGYGSWGSGSGYGASGYDSNSCAASCFGYTCDYWDSVGMPCATMEDTYGCSCTGCSCEADDGDGGYGSGGDGSSWGYGSGSWGGGETNYNYGYGGNDQYCVNSCFGQTCDYWESVDMPCATMEASYGCDCSGCSSCNDDGGGYGSGSWGGGYYCQNTCFGETCDYWSSVGHSCGDLESLYGCECTDCSCGGSGYGGYGYGGGCTPEYESRDNVCSEFYYIEAEIYCIDSMTLGDTVSDTTMGCSKVGQDSPEHMYKLTLTEDTFTACGGDAVLISTCGSGFDTVRSSRASQRTRHEEHERLTN